MQLGEKIVFVVHTLYQVHLSMKILAEFGSERDCRFIIIDLISDCRLTEIQCPRPGLELIRIAINKKFFAQLFSSHLIVQRINQRIGVVDRLYIYNDVEPVVALLAKSVKKSRGEVFFVEEGLSAYRTIPWYRFEYFKGVLKKTVSIVFGLKYNIKFGHSPYISKLLLTNPSIFRKNHPKNRTASEIISNDLASYFNGIKDGYLAHVSELLSGIKYPAMFYLSQPLSESGLIEESAEIEIIDRIRDICLLNEVNFYVKKHPSDRFLKYRDAECISTSLPAEIVINFLEKERVIICSPFSSVNFNFSGHHLLANIHLYKIFGLSPSIPNLPVDVVDSLAQINEIMRSL